MSEISKEAVEALRIRQLLEGTEVKNSEKTKVVEKEKVKAEKKKVTRKRTTKKSEEVVRQDIIKLSDCFNNLLSKASLSVNMCGHDIHYKEQLWGIDSRNIKYEIKLITRPIEAKKAAALIYKNNEKEMQKAYNGELACYKVVTDEIVPFNAKTIAFIGVINTDKGLVTKVFTNAEQLKKVNINPDKLRKALEGKSKELIEYCR